MGEGNRGVLKQITAPRNLAINTSKGKLDRKGAVLKTKRQVRIVTALDGGMWQFYLPIVYLATMGCGCFRTHCKHLKKHYNINMLDIKYIRENPEVVKKAINDKHVSTAPDIDEFLQLDQKYLELLRRIESHRSLRNNLSSDISKVADTDARQKLLQEASTVKEELASMEDEIKVLKSSLDDQLLRIPNIYSPAMPVGKGEEGNLIVKVWFPDKGYLGIKEPFSYFEESYFPQNGKTYKDHIELGKSLDIIDIEQSALVSGSRFAYLKNEIVLMQDALSTFMKQKLNSMGFMPIIPPLLVKDRALTGTSHFPEGKDQVYKIENFNVEEGQELYLVGSSEPSNFAYFMDKTIPANKLPIKMYAQTACFRSEVGSWGKDVKGIKRVHQSDKLEMDVVCTPEQGQEIFDELLSINEWFYQQLQIPYRVVNKCTGDCGYNASYLQYDIEAWRPATREYMEVATDTLATDYQARRLNIKYKDDSGNKYVYTVNDTGIPFGRVLIAILENYQQEDGSVLIPEVLQSYMGMEKIARKV